MQHPSRRPVPARPAAVPARPSASRTPRRPAPRKMKFQTSTLLVAGVGVLFALVVLFVGGVLVILYASGNLDTESNEPPAVLLARDGLILRDGSDIWALPPDQLGAAGFALVEGDPGFSFDNTQLTAYLQNAKPQIDVPAVNAGVRLQAGQVVAVPAVEGRELDVLGTVSRLSTDPVEELSDGALDLVMLPVYPTMTDANPLVAQASALLSSSFTVQGYDPIRDEWHNWSAPPEVWAAWLTATPQATDRLALAFQIAGPEAFLTANAVFGDERYIDVEAAMEAMQTALANNQTTVTVRIRHNPTQYTVQSGETLAAIGEKLGMPYPYIAAENAGVNINALSAGEVLTIPSQDVLVPLDVVPSKRIIVSRSQQHLWAYDNGQVVFDWAISTGISTSPTALGVFQIQSHEINAYADQWDLYMPHFMGFYHPGPNMDLWNGFHGFPTRSGGYLLWTDDLGRPATYGCILLSLENAETLYNWAEEGVVVAVQA